MKRREFITLLSGAAAWPLAASAQQGDRVRRIGVLLAGDENDPEQKRRLSAFTQALAGLGWTDGRNVRMDFRWGGGDINWTRAGAAACTKWFRNKTISRIFIGLDSLGQHWAVECAGDRCPIVGAALGGSIP